MIRTAILGAGIGAQHLAAMRVPGGHFTPRLIVDMDTDRAAAIAGNIPCTTRIDDALDDPKIDLIDICLPPHLHVPTALRALEAGKHVICEKPLATCLADIDRLRAAASASGRHVFPVFQYRWGPGLAALRALVAGGLAGAPQLAALETHWSRGAEYYAVPWRGTWAGEQGGAIVGHAIHAHDLLTSLFGPVASVSAELTTRINPIETDDCAAIACVMANGALATSSVTLGAARDETRLRLVFANLTATSGTLPYTPGEGAWEFTARDPADQPRIDAICARHRGAPCGYRGFLGAVADTLNGAPTDAVTLEDGARSVELITAIYAAARSGRRVSLPLARDHPLWNGWQPSAPQQENGNGP